MKSEDYYIQFSLSPPCTDPLTIRKTLQDGLIQSFGIVSSSYLDVLWVSDDGEQTVVRVHKQSVYSIHACTLMTALIGDSDAPKILGAVVGCTASPRMSVIQDSCFLPSFSMMREWD